jgi:hypothetical protein
MTRGDCRVGRNLRFAGCLGDDPLYCNPARSLQPQRQRVQMMRMRPGQTGKQLAQHGERREDRPGAAPPVGKTRLDRHPSAPDWIDGFRTSATHA